MRHTRKYSTKQQKRRLVDLALYRHGINNDALNSRIQHGGAVRCSEKRGTVLVDGVDYPYSCFRDDPHTLVFNGGGDKRPCFILYIMPEDKTAVLINIEGSALCNAKLAARAAFSLAASKGVKEIELTDTAAKKFPGGERLYISNMEFLTQGRSWYETFLPIRPKKNIDDYRVRVLTNTWNDIYMCLCNIKGRVVPIPVDVSDIDTVAVGSAAQVFQRIKDAKTNFFINYNDELMLCSGVPSLVGYNWVSLPSFIL